MSVPVADISASCHSRVVWKAPLKHSVLWDTKCCVFLAQEIGGCVQVDGDAFVALLKDVMKLL